MHSQFDSCSLCPRGCKVNRNKGEKGFCKAGALPKVARAALHFWEEPCISGVNGSGTVFFSHCTLGCLFCQNSDISHEGFGIEITDERLCDIFLELQDKGAHNINLVTPTHFAPNIMAALDMAKIKGLSIPVVYNCGGYETVDTIKMLAPYVDIWLPDFKYFDNKAGMKYSHAVLYPQTALNAINEMVKLAGPATLNDEDMMISGVMVRHLMLPGRLADSLKTVELLYECFGDDIIISLMSQYTPPKVVGIELAQKYPELCRRVNPRHYQALVEFAEKLGIERCYLQNTCSAREEYIPVFDGEGVAPQG